MRVEATEKRNSRDPLLHHYGFEREERGRRDPGRGGRHGVQGKRPRGLPAKAFKNGISRYYRGEKKDRPGGKGKKEGQGNNEKEISKLNCLSIRVGSWSHFGGGNRKVKEKESVWRG